MAAAKAPTPMWVGQSATVELAVGPKGSPVATTVAALPGNTVTFTPEIGRFVQASLEGEGFKVQLLSKQAIQPVMADSPTVWDWKVTALEAGQKTLTLTTVVEARTSDGSYHPLRQSITHQAVVVNITWWAKFWNAVDVIPARIKSLTAIVTASSALLAALAVLFHRLWRRRRSSGPA